VKKTATAAQLLPEKDLGAETRVRRVSEYSAPHAVPAKSGRLFRTDAESNARVVIDERRGRPLTEKEWVEHRRRLIEFARTLARWDREQRSGAPPSETRCSDEKIKV
jgi:hypothetical protein